MRLPSATALAVALLAPLSASALEVPAQPLGRVSDFAGALDGSGRARLEAQLSGYAEGTQLRYGVAIFRSLEDQSLEDFSLRLATTWKIGSKQDPEGILVVVFLAEHKIRVEVGYGLEDKITDVFSARLIRETIAPAFRAGDLAGGLQNAFAAIDKQATGRSHVPPAQQRGRGQGRGGMTSGFILFVMIVVLMIVSRRGGRGGRGGGAGDFALGWLLGSLGSSSWSGGRDDNDDGGGGFGGFGGDGGGFGGGGASGDW